MLRRTERVSFSSDDEDNTDKKWRKEAEAVSAAQRAERRNQDALRTEFLQAVIATEEGTLEADERISRWTGFFAPSRLILLAVAIIAGGGAAWLATHGDQPAPEAAIVAAPAPTPAPVVVTVTAPPKIVEEPKAQVLVAKVPIAPGTPFTPEMAEWQSWPKSTLRPEYLTEDGAPTATADLSGLEAKTDILPGEPLRTDKFARAGAGYLSEVLPNGMRGVSVSVSAESAAGGFIVPGDHVDVLLTPNDAVAHSPHIVLADAKVLAINTDLGLPEEGKQAEVGPKKQVGFENSAIATLALDPMEAETVTHASMLGKLTLLLRPVDETATAEEARQIATNQQIRMTSAFWQN